MCAGMTGGVLYLRLQPELNLDEAALRRRIARGADVVLLPVAPEDEEDLRELIQGYAEALAENHQQEEAKRILSLLDSWEHTFVKVVPTRVEEAACAIEPATEEAERVPA
jgi:glutamate synthase (NADPH/NADH) large chain